MNKNNIKNIIKIGVGVGAFALVHSLGQNTLESMLKQDFKFSDVQVHNDEGCGVAVRSTYANESFLGNKLGNDFNSFCGIYGDAWRILPNMLYSSKEDISGIVGKIKNVFYDVLRSGNTLVFNIYQQNNINPNSLQEKIDLYQKINTEWTKLVEEGNRSNIEENKIISDKYGEEINNLYSSIDADNLKNMKNNLKPGDIIGLQGTKSPSRVRALMEGYEHYMEIKDSPKYSDKYKMNVLLTSISNTHVGYVDKDKNGTLVVKDYVNNQWVVRDLDSLFGLNEEYIPVWGVRPSSLIKLTSKGVLKDSYFLKSNEDKNQCDFNKSVNDVDNLLNALSFNPYVRELEKDL
jgi:hypothetical protein